MREGKLNDKERAHLLDCLNDAICANCECGLDWEPSRDLTDVVHGEVFSLRCSNCGAEEELSTSLFFQKGWDE